MPDLVREAVTKRVEQAKAQDSKFADLDLAQISIQKFTIPEAILIESCQFLEVLYLVKCNINSLEILPKCNLIGLDLSYNLINDQSGVEYLCIYSGLETLILSHNAIEHRQSIIELESIKNLQQLDLRNNPVLINTSNNMLFQKFPKLSLINGEDRNGFMHLLDSDQSQSRQFVCDEDQIGEDQINEEDQPDNSSQNQGSQDKKISRKKKSIQQI